jgi:hypothetical protein
MNTYGVVNPSDYTVETFYNSAPIGWQLVSSSLGTTVTVADYVGAVTVNRANSNRLSTASNADTGYLEYNLYASIRHLFYTNALFYSGSSLVTSSLAPLTSNSYVVSIGQMFYGDRIKPSSFELSLDSLSNVVRDDGYGNLYVSQSSVGHYVGNIFYDKGIAVVKEETNSGIATVSGSGIKIVNGTEVYVDYSSDLKTTKHQINVKVTPSEFNFSMLNRSMRQYYVPTASVAQSFINKNIPSKNNANVSWSLYSLMSADIIKPYITTVGLYNSNYELLAIGKLSTPIQRSSDIEQIFIIRFDT